MNIQDELMNLSTAQSASASAQNLIQSSPRGQGKKQEQDSSQNLNVSPLSADDSKLEEMNDSLAKIGHSMRLRVDEDTKSVQAEILDSNNKVVRKIPSDELIKLSASLKKGNVALNRSV